MKKETLKFLFNFFFLVVFSSSNGFAGKLKVRWAHPNLKYYILS